MRLDRCGSAARELLNRFGAGCAAAAAAVLKNIELFMEVVVWLRKPLPEKSRQLRRCGATSRVALCIWKSRASRVSALKYVAAAAYSSLIPEESPSWQSERTWPQEGRKPLERPVK